MAGKIEKYMPDLDRIKEHSKTPDPLVLSPEEYDEILAEHKLYRGSRLSDVGLLKCMELGLIKIWNEDGTCPFNEERVQSCSYDVTQGNEFWHYIEHEISEIEYGTHKETIQNLDLLAYNFRNTGETFVYHPGSVVLSFIGEGISLANVVSADLGGKSSLGRLGTLNHQTASLAHAGFSGKIMTEHSVSNRLSVKVPVGAPIGTLVFTLLDQPSTRPENQKSDSLSKAYRQRGPFGYWKDKWTQIKAEAIGRYILARENGSVTNDHYLVDIRRKAEEYDSLVARGIIPGQNPVPSGNGRHSM